MLQSELASQLKAANAKQEALIAKLQDKNEKLAVTNQKLTSELEEKCQKLDEKAEQLKAIEQKMDEVIKTLTFYFDEIKEHARDIHQMSMPGYLPLSVEETAESLLSVVPPKKPGSASSQIKAATKREHHTSGPETYEQRNVTLRNRPSIPPTKPTSIPRRK